MAEFFGTTIAGPRGLAWTAPTIAIFSPPAAANTGGRVADAADVHRAGPHGLQHRRAGGEVGPGDLERQLADQPGRGEQRLGARAGLVPDVQGDLETLVVPALLVPPRAGSWLAAWTTSSRRRSGRAGRSRRPAAVTRRTAGRPGPVRPGAPGQFRWWSSVVSFHGVRRGGAVRDAGSGSVPTPSSSSRRVAQGASSGWSRSRGPGHRDAGRCSAIRPSASTSTRSASAMASSTSCVTSSTAGWWCAHSRSTSRCMLIRVSASSALNGSSSSSRLGSRTRARASAARWASPPDRVSGQASARPVRPTSSSAPRATARGSAAGRRGAARGSDVVADPAPGHQPRLLEGDRRGAGHVEFPGDRAVQPGQRAQQGGLAGPAAADQRDELAGRDVQVELGPGRAGHRSPGSARVPGGRAAGAAGGGGGARPSGPAGRGQAALSDPAVRGAMPGPSFPAAGRGRR